MNEHIICIIIMCLVVCIAIYLLCGINSPGECFNPKIYEYNPAGKTTILFVAGVHGNEPAGSVALMSLINNGYFATMSNSTNTHVYVIPMANKCGLALNTRWIPNFFHPDINRNFGSTLGDETISKKILAVANNSDLVIDFHEGWGFHQVTNESVGSTIMPTKSAANLAAAMVTNVNQLITENLKKFIVYDQDSCHIDTTLRCNMEKINKPYVLIETSGQNNLQSMSIRTDQVKSVVATVFANVNS